MEQGADWDGDDEYEGGGGLCVGVAVIDECCDAVMLSSAVTRNLELLSLSLWLVLVAPHARSPFGQGGDGKGVEGQRCRRHPHSGAFITVAMTQRKEMPC